ncbi:MAG: dihydroxyacetone kinase subunit L [Firmicutes bacterium]|nr:dihydroxyacetone kinase subunit L [Dethiobacter sp.]MBS3887704.1 dihydroxyacetone kinase subunit L [Bacillota bacterium]
MNKPFLMSMEAILGTIKENKEWLTELDGAIGDADHGINMARGFAAVVAKIAVATEDDLASLLKKVGMTLLSTVGGVSGPLYGTAFLRAGAAAQGQADLTKEVAGEMLATAIAGIRERGKAAQGEKTMLDALLPAQEAFARGLEEGKNLLECLEAACVAAEAGVEYTKTIMATKGRASYLGVRSIGHQDPGATSAYLILRALTEFCRAHSQGAA